MLEDRSYHYAAVVTVCSRFVDGYRHNHTGIFGRCKTDESGNVFVIDVTSVDQLTRRTGFCADVETIYRTRRTPTV